jgi:hypothetical protein
LKETKMWWWNHAATKSKNNRPVCDYITRVLVQSNKISWRMFRQEGDIAQVTWYGVGQFNLLDWGNNPIERSHNFRSVTLL